MADIQKPTEVPKETTPATEPTFEAKPIDTTVPTTETTAPGPVVPETLPEAATTTETPAEAPAAAAVEDSKKTEPIEAGNLEHKGLNFPKNLIYSKQYFWFGGDALEPKTLSSYLKNVKSTETGHHNVSWASHTGKGLLFFGDKSAPSGVINLADAVDPSWEGHNKFHITSNGHKHTFKAATSQERDNWVAQLKLKIAEAKELASSVKESESYKSTLESFKPKTAAAPAKKEEDETPKEEAAVPAVAAATTSAAVEEPAKTEEAKKEDKEEPKRRSASRKRGSIFGSLLGKKEESKKEEKAEKATTPEPTPATTEAPVEPVAPAVAAVTEPASETPAVTEPAPAAAATETPAEDKPIESKETTKPAVSKRNSIFGNVFSKKEKKAAEPEVAPTPVAKDTEVTPAADAAPVIPPVETTTPLAAEVASPATVPVETVDITPATNGESKKEVRSEKRKSSLPFAFGNKKDKAVASDEEGEKPEKSSAFSKLRATIKGRGKPSGEKPVEKTEATPEETTSAEAATTEAPKPIDEPENKPAPVSASTPAVTAAA